MPVTRSASTRSIPDAILPKSTSKSPRVTPTTTKKVKPSASVPPPALPFTIPPRTSEPVTIPAALTFSFATAKQHIINSDPRWEDVFSRLPCKPYEILEPVDPFEALVHSILGQQISWLAARSISHRFIRLYFPDRPEVLPPLGDPLLKLLKAEFPTAEQVAATPLPVLRSAGLSGRKAEYINDLAQRFADGRLSTEKLAKATDEELEEMLIEVRGIGKWTVHMFSIFTLRRPNILPVGDLGVQRGLLRWVLTSHTKPGENVTLSPKKAPGPSKTEDNIEEASQAQSNFESQMTELMDVDNEGGGSVSTLILESQDSQDPFQAPSTPKKPKGTVSSLDGEDDNGENAFPIPPPFTPSINRTLKQPTLATPHPLPSGLSVSVLKSRLEGKKVKGAFLTPEEMETLTECWKPYRSVGVYFMWALAEEDTKPKKK